MIKLAVGILLVLGLAGCSSLDQAKSRELGDELKVSNELLEDAPQSIASSYAANPQVQAFIDRLVKNDHFDKKRLELALEQQKQTLNINIEQAFADAKAALKQYIKEKKRTIEIFFL